MTDVHDTDPNLLDGPTLEEANAAAAVISPEPADDTDGTIPEGGDPQ